MSDTDLSSGLDLAGGYSRRIKKTRSGRSSVSRKIKVSTKSREAVFKIGKKYAKTPASVKNMVDYISRDGDLELVDQDGNPVQHEDERVALIEDWQDGFSKRKNPRLAVHMIVSAPETAKAQDVIKASKEWAKENLADFDFVQVTHLDEPNVHTHFIVAKKPNRKRLSFSPKEIQEMKDSWAKIGSANNIPMVSSSRLERGKTRKSLKQEAIHIRRRDGFTKSDLQAAEEVLGEATQQTENPWENVIQNRLTSERAEYEGIAKALDVLASKDPARAAEIALTAKLVKRQAMALRQVKTRRRIMRGIVENTALPNVNAQSDPKELAIAYAKGDNYQRQVASPAKDAIVRAEIDKVRRSIALTTLAQTKAGETIRRGAQTEGKDTERD